MLIYCGSHVRVNYIGFHITATRGSALFSRRITSNLNVGGIILRSGTSDIPFFFRLTNP